VHVGHDAAAFGDEGAFGFLAAHRVVMRLQFLFLLRDALGQRFVVHGGKAVDADALAREPHGDESHDGQGAELHKCLALYRVKVGQGREDVGLGQDRGDGHQQADGGGEYLAPGRGRFLAIEVKSLQAMYGKVVSSISDSHRAAALLAFRTGIVR
jgi:hypothetical protein